MSLPERPRRRGRTFAKSILLILLAGSIGASFWFGLVPQAINPLPRLVLSEPDPWFLDFRIAALRRNPALCAATLTEPQVSARPVSDNPVRNGCGWENAVRLSSVGGAGLPVGTVTCEMAAALALWVEHDVQPLAQRLLGSKVTRIAHMGGYACRNIIGSKALRSFRSQHATANAIDIAGFDLASGQRIRLARDWNRTHAESQFLKRVHRAACRYFRVALSPNYNAAHHDHFHFDRGPFVRCR